MATAMGQPTDRQYPSEEFRTYLTNLQLKLLREKLANERKHSPPPPSSRSSSSASNRSPDPQNYDRLRTLIRSRQKILDRLKEKRKTADHDEGPPAQLPGEPGRPYTFNPPGHRYWQSMYPHVDVYKAPKTSQSLPDITKSKGEVHYPYPYPYRYPDISDRVVSPMLINPASLYPVLPPVGASLQYPPDNRKTDIMEMMMLQNAQMHQSVMQHMMLSSIQGKQEKSNRDCSPLPSVIMPPPVMPAPPAVHHHHYDRAAAGGGGGFFQPGYQQMMPRRRAVKPKPPPHKTNPPPPKNDKEPAPVDDGPGDETVVYLPK